MATNTFQDTTSQNTLDRRGFIKTSSALIAMAAIESRFNWAMAADERLPNIVFIFCDDLGYGDIGSFGSGIPTPNIDSLAKEGVRFTHFSASPLCSPSRAGLMTGRYATRVGVPRVLMSGSEGLELSETTIANILKDRGYATMCIGKWHLGDKPGYLPTSRGFDEYYGIPYSNDITPVVLMHNTETIEYPVTQATLTKRYTEQALKFIERSRDKPFFLYMPHTFPHTPLAASEQFLGKSGMGLYADSIEEIDWSVGEILKTLKNNGLENNTLVVFTSDNGPASGEGSPGGLRGRKGSTWEGGVRTPFLAKLPGQIPADSVCSSVAATIDILPTLANLTGAKLPEKSLDGVNIWPMLSGKQKQVDRDVLLYWEAWTLTAARLGKWKVRFTQASSGMGGGMPPMGGTQGSAPSGAGTQQAEPSGRQGGAPQGSGQAMSGVMAQTETLPALYDLEADRDESYNAASAHPDIVADITARVERLVPGFPQEVQKAWAETRAKFTASGAASK